MNGRKTGQIKLKDGSTFKLKSVKPNREDKQSKDSVKNNKQLFGFSAEQREGLKLLHDAQQNNLNDDIPAPASVKRQRVHERLGDMYAERKANANTAHIYDNKQNVQLFLNELCGDGTSRQNDLNNQQ